MTPSHLVRWIARLAPSERRPDVLADLEAGLRARSDRVGPGRARLWLAREAVGLLVWRVREGLASRMGRDASLGEGMTTMGGNFLRDLRFGARTLRRRPAFTVTAILVLGLGIGAPTTVFTLVDRIFFWSPPEVEEPDRLLRVYRGWEGGGGGSLQHPDFRYYRENRPTALSGLAAWSGGDVVAYSADGRSSDQMHLGFVSDNYFEVLGLEPTVGRWLTEAENAAPGAAASVVIGYGFWERAYGADPDAVGRTLRINGSAFTVVGVAPRGFEGLSPLGEVPDAWAPIAMYGAVSGTTSTAWWERLPNQRSSWLQVVGRLAVGATFEQAEAGLHALSDALEYEARMEGETILVARQVLYNPNTASALESLSRMLLGAVAIVLVVAAANVAVLLLARATTRTREIGIRQAVGAGRGRVVRQLFAETLLLALLGGAVGAGLARVSADAAGSLLPYAFAGPFRPDPGVLLAALGLTLLTTLVVGLAPAMTAARTDPARAIRDGRTDGGGGRLRSALVVAQIALSVVLVAGAVLFTRSFREARGEGIGFETQNRLLVQFDLRTPGMDGQSGRAFLERALDRIETLPGVEAVTTTRQVPFQGDWSTDFEADPARFPEAPAEPVFVGLNAVSPGYFEVMGMPIRRGRGFVSSDGPGAPPVVVVNETLAETLWPNRDPLGRTLFQDPEEEPPTVVGVVADAQYYQLGEDPVAHAWMPVQQSYQPIVNLLVATRTDPTELAAPVQAALRELEPNLAFGRVSSLGEVFESVTARYRVSAALVGLFGLIALLLAATGLYGVMAFTVARRTREIGVRMALGADRGRVAGTVLGSGLRLAAVGSLLGLLATLWVRRFAASLIYGVEPSDPWALVGAPLVLLSVAALATWLPARRATRVDPLVAMRTE